jgi:hypothetical protein
METDTGWIKIQGLRFHWLGDLAYRAHCNLEYSFLTLAEANAIQEASFVNSKSQSFYIQIKSRPRFLIWRKPKYYLPLGVVIVTSFMLHGSAPADASSFVTLTWKYAGCLGSGRLILSLLSIATTSDVVGLSAAFSCTHSRAMLTHLIIANVQQSVTNDASASWSHLFSFHDCHAC